ncbi:SapC family protein [Thiorhodococcus fuscus]|uniref:SapC family protein n=1 Tax=Thiorhodococcus fuscus TaxID=527200 RepID=A0ABW4YC60_9GAMM
MPKFTPISRERHAEMCWRRFDSYGFARQANVASLVASEMPKASSAMPLAFIRQGEDFLPVALMGLEPGKNLFVASDGRWLGRYVPAAFRGQPFAFAKLEDGGLVLCIDEESELVGEHHGAEQLLTAEGEPTEAVKQVLDFLRQVEADRGPTKTACAALVRHDLIRPWPITLKDESGEQKVEGIHQVDEAALNQLSDEAFLDLRRCGALLLAYCQLLSIQHLPMLGELAKLHAQAVSAPQPSVSTSFSLHDDDVLNFG